MKFWGRLSRVSLVVIAVSAVAVLLMLTDTTDAQAYKQCVNLGSHTGCIIVDEAPCDNGVCFDDGWRQWAEYQGCNAKNYLGDVYRSLAEYSIALRDYIADCIDPGGCPPAGRPFPVYVLPFASC